MKLLKSKKVTESEICNSETAIDLGLLEEEFELIQKKLGRSPNFTELAMFSGMWSEHCSYKNSILLLKKLYSDSNRILAKPGSENAGALKISDKLALVFKIESHNHPSAIEPYQGAATGVGGIMRDIFTMGARPVASLNSLRFGPLKNKENRYLMKQVVKGIGDYGNSLGISCMGGEIFFHDSYTKNPLVNAMVIGVAKIDQITFSKANGPGNIVMYGGAKTGRDGIHGASFASKNLSEDSEQERSAVQVGDPFMEKLLMEASLECIQKKLILSIQDMGAAGLISSCSEMSASGGVGIKINLEKIPAREENMLPFEFMLSESQERMLLIVKPENVLKVQKIYNKWKLNAVPIGEICFEKNIILCQEGKVCAKVPSELLVNEAPRYKRKSQMPPKPDNWSEEYDIWAMHHAVKEKNALKLTEIITQMMSDMNIASKKYVYEQYDTDIGLRRWIGPGQNAGMIKLKQENLGITASVDGNGYYVHLDPYDGAQHIVAEGFRNIVSTGSEPIGITNCLNFADPYVPHNFYFFEKAVQGMSDAAEFFKIPITGGNVSFYNESKEGPILPTPTIGMVGIHHDPDTALGICLNPLQNIFLMGDFIPELRSSWYRYIFQKKSGPLPLLKLKAEETSANFLRKAQQNKLIAAAIDISLGGLMVALLRMLFSTMESYKKEIGFTYDPTFIQNTYSKDISLDEVLWGESAHCYLIAIEDKNLANLLRFSKKHSTKLLPLGKVTFKPELQFTDDLSVPLKDPFVAWANAIENSLKTY